MKHLIKFEAFDANDIKDSLSQLHSVLREVIRSNVDLKEIEDNFFFILINDLEYYLSYSNRTIGLIRFDFLKLVDNNKVEEEFSVLKKLINNRREFLEKEYGFLTQCQIKINGVSQNKYNERELKWNILNYDGSKVDKDQEGQSKISIQFFIV